MSEKLRRRGESARELQLSGKLRKHGKFATVQEATKAWEIYGREMIQIWDKIVATGADAELCLLLLLHDSFQYKPG